MATLVGDTQYIDEGPIYDNSREKALLNTGALHHKATNGYVVISQIPSKLERDLQP